MQAPDAPTSSRGWKPDDPRRRRVADKRQAIIDAARPIFLAEGVAGTSLERIAAESGIAKMTVYRHFHSKEELFAALVDSMCAGMVAEAERTPPPPEGQPLEDLLRSEARAFTAALIEPDALALYRLIVADGWRFPALARTFERSGMAVLRRRVALILSGDRVSGEQAAARAAGFINLALGDAYLEASIGLDDADPASRFAKQIEMAIRFALQPFRTVGSDISEAHPPLG